MIIYALLLATEGFLHLIDRLQWPEATVNPPVPRYITLQVLLEGQHKVHLSYPTLELHYISRALVGHQVPHNITFRAAVKKRATHTATISLFHVLFHP